MATIRDVCTTSLRRLRILAAGEAMVAEDAALLLDALNSMVHGWAAQGVDCAHQAWTLEDDFRLFVPHKLVTGETMAALDYRGTWNAATNAPALASGAGTQGHLYRVGTAGTTALDGVASWSANDYLVFNGDVWLRGKSPERHEGAVADLLAMSVAAEFGKEPSQLLAMSARDGWIGLQADYVRVDAAEFDPAVVMMPTRRYYGVLQS